MPTIASDDLPLLGSTTKGKQANVDLGEAAPSINQTKIENLQNRIRQCKNYLLPAIGILVIFSFFATLVGLFVGTGSLCNKLYPSVVVTPYPDYNQITNNTIILTTQPCYYPVSSENSTDNIYCSEFSLFQARYLFIYNFSLDIDSPTEYYCPKYYACITNTTLFPSPYIGCVSLNNSCGDLPTCVSIIDDLPNTDDNSKILVVDYSPTVLLIFGIGGSIFILISVIITACHMLMHFKQFDKHNKKFIIAIYVSFAVAFIFIMVSGGFYFSMDKLSYTYGANCYSSSEINYTLGKITSVYFGYMITYILTSFGILMYAYLGASAVLAIRHNLRKLQKEEEKSANF